MLLELANLALEVSRHPHHRQTVAAGIKPAMSLLVGRGAADSQDASCLFDVKKAGTSTVAMAYLTVD